MHDSDAIRHLFEEVVCILTATLNTQQPKATNMPKQLSNDQRREILLLRALDYTKQEIAEEVGVSRNTVSRHLEEMREQIESSENREMALAEILFEPDDLLPFILEQSGIALSNLNEDVLQSLLTSRSNDDK